MADLNQLIDVIKTLRGPNGCPWDKEQTLESLTPHIIEEAYELVDAIQSQDSHSIKEELGDVLLHVIMLSHIAEDDQLFILSDVVKSIEEKMIRRHPHVFGETQLNSVDEVWQNWEKIKSKEKEQGPFDSIPAHLPALMKATKIQKKAARLDYNITSEIEKIPGYNALHQLTEDLTQGTDAIPETLGNLLFSLVYICNKKNCDPETLLTKINKHYKSSLHPTKDAAKQ